MLRVMIPSYPAQELPLDALLLFAAENQITAAIDLRSSLAAGRIDIVRGVIFDAAFGGLTCEAAIRAALDSQSLHVLRGRLPPKSIERRVWSSTAQIIANWKAQLEQEPKAPHHATGSLSTNRPRRSGKPSLLRLLRLGAFLGASIVVLGAVVQLAWSAPGRLSKLHAAPSLRSEEKGGCSEQPMRALAGRTILTNTPSLRGQACTLVAQALISETGSVSGVRIHSMVDCSDEFENLAIDSLLQTRFEPARCRGRVVAGWAELPIVFDSAGTSGTRDGALARR